MLYITLVLVTCYRIKVRFWLLLFSLMLFALCMRGIQLQYPTGIPKDLIVLIFVIRKILLRVHRRCGPNHNEKRCVCNQRATTTTTKLYL